MGRWIAGSNCVALALTTLTTLAASVATASAAPAFTPFGGLPGGDTADLSHDGSTLVVGDPVADELRVYTRPDGGWDEPLGAPAELTAFDWRVEQLGYGVAISDDGATIVASAPDTETGASYTGVAYVYERGGSDWTSQEAPTSGRVNAMGAGAVAISGDGDTIAIGGTPASGWSTRIYVRATAGGWSATSFTQLSAYAGSDHIELSRDGGVAVFADPSGGGAATALIRPANGWSNPGREVPNVQFTTGLTGGIAGFGASIALSRDARTLVVGAPGEYSDGVDDGAVVVYDVPRSTTTETPQAVLRTSGVAAGAVGERVDVSDDGATIAAATRDVLSGAPGAVHVFVRDATADWSSTARQATTVNAVAPFPGDRFGNLVRLAADGRTLLAGNATTLSWFAGDTTPPTIAVQSLAGAPSGRDGWYVEPVGVTLSADDGGSGIAETRCATDLPGPPASFYALPAGPCAHVGELTFTTSGHRSFYAASRDALGNVSAVRGVTFDLDATPPSLLVPSSIEADAPVPGGTTVQYSYSASDDYATAVPVVCAPGPGAYFPVGSSTVRCNAVDQAGNVTTRAFVVTVHGEPAPAGSDPGDQRPGTGDQTPASGDQTPGTGDQTPAPGGETPGTGGQTPAPGGPGPAQATPDPSRPAPTPAGNAPADAGTAPSGQPRVRPRLSALSLRRRTLSLHVSAAATVRVQLARCTSAGAHRRAVCRATVTLTARARRAGTVTLTLPARVAAGGYRVTASATTSAGGRSAALVKNVAVARR